MGTLSSPESRSAFWRAVATSLITAVVVLISSWLAIGRDIVTEGEVRRIVATEAPYVQDRQLLQQAVNTNSQAIADQRSELVGIQITLAGMIVKLDSILAELERARDFER